MPRIPRMGTFSQTTLTILHGRDRLSALLRRRGWRAIGISGVTTLTNTRLVACIDDPLPNNNNYTEMAGHHKEKLEQQGEEEKDVYETLIENSGCSRFHFALQDCYFEYNDWRKCQKEMAEFKQCMSEHSKQKEKRSQEQR